MFPDAKSMRKYSIQKKVGNKAANTIFPLL